MAGIGKLDFYILIPAGIGAVLTLILLSKFVNMLFERHYAVAFHAIVGVVIAATIMIISFDSFACSIREFFVNMVCIVTGIFSALKLDHFNQKYDR